MRPSSIDGVSTSPGLPVQRGVVASGTQRLIADHLGLLADAESACSAGRSLAAELHLTRGSGELMEGLPAGRYDVVHAAPDNFIEWRDRTGEDIVAWIRGASGPLQLIGSPGLAGVGDLAGREIAVDSPDSGFVSILMKILRAGGRAGGRGCHRGRLPQGVVRRHHLVVHSVARV